MAKEDDRAARWTWKPGEIRIIKKSEEKPKEESKETPGFAEGE